MTAIRTDRVHSRSGVPGGRPDYTISGANWWGIGADAATDVGPVRVL